MKVQDVKYCYRFNCGNYEHEEIELSGRCEIKDDINENLATLRKIVHDFHGSHENKEQLNLDLNEKEEKKKEEGKEEEKTSEKPKKEKTKKPKKTKSKIVKYDRSLDQHKSIMSDFCLEVFGEGWRQDSKVVAKVKQASSIMTDNEDFIDGNCEILPSFKKMFLELVK